MDTKDIIKKIAKVHEATPDEISAVIKNSENDGFLFECADKVRREAYGTDVYIRGLIEFTNYCKNNCFYCGIRRDNRNIKRYRLSIDEIMECCEEGYKLGFRTFVLQGGEDAGFTDDILCNMISGIKKRYSDCAVTLSMGERTEESYKRLYDSGADRYLLRHETASKEHYGMLHPPEMSFERRIECLNSLKKSVFRQEPGLWWALLFRQLKILYQICCL